MSENIVLGGGCFWCVEAAFKQVDGVEQAVSGYAGGQTENPSYREVCTGETGHAEVVKVVYDEEELGLTQILKKFFKIHNPTTKNREGPDVGTQYRSIILFETEEQKHKIEQVLDEVSKNYSENIVTEIKHLDGFYRAEEKHQDYFSKNPEDAYCKMHAEPKMKKIS